MTENWDDDFEFSPNSPPRKKNHNTTTTTTTTDDAGQTRMSTTCSRFIVDWDDEVGDSPLNASSGQRTKVFTAPKLSEWAEPGPSTPARRHLPAATSRHTITENWDDDFEDKNDTPVRRTRGDHQSSPTKEITRNYRSMLPLSNNENIDKLSTTGRNRASSSASTQYARTKYMSFSGDIGDEEEEDDDFGFMYKDEEDKTLTGRSRRPGLARLNSLTNRPLNLTPLPPVPPLHPLLTTVIAAGSVASQDRGDNPQPFPRSPSSSVFSLPTTIASDSAHYDSTAYLHPTASKTSSSGHGSVVNAGGGGGARVSSGGFFASLPPSPPIHKERERRRLRKKSRPPPHGMFELVPFEAGYSSNYTSSLAALQEVERPTTGDGERDKSPARESARSSISDSHPYSRPRTPETPASDTFPPVETGGGVPASQPPVNANVTTSTPSSKRHSTSSPSPPPPVTPSSAKGALFSRIGSVKKWGVRRKRGASGSQSNVVQAEGQQDATMAEDSRPTSSLSSIPSTKTDDKDLGNGFIRSVRKISIVGRHRREKSTTTTSPTNAMMMGRPSLGSRSQLGDSVADDGHDTKDTTETTKDSKDTIATPEPQSPPALSQARRSPPPPPIDVPPPAVETETEEKAPQTEEEEEEGADAKPALPQTPRKVSDPPLHPTTPATPRNIGSPASSHRGLTTSPQSASLGRAAYSPTRRDSGGLDDKVTPRRSSLGDLKIPARISQAQLGLRRDLGMVREFAFTVEQLKELQTTYHTLVVEVQELLDSHAHLHAQQQITRSVSPSFFSRPVGRKRSSTGPPAPDPTRQLVYKQLASSFYTINSKYRITWECAELLIELGGGSTGPGPPRPTTSVSAPVGVQVNGDEGSSLTRGKGRERAITLAGDEPKPPSPMPGMHSPLDGPNGVPLASSTAWHGSSRRQELSQRQMVLLKELLNNADSSFITEDPKPTVTAETFSAPSANKEWKWGDPSNSTVTLPPSESSGAPSSSSSMAANKKTRTRKLGMGGLRDLLKMLKRYHTAHPAHPTSLFGTIPQSTTSLASSVTNSSSDIRSGNGSVSNLHQPDDKRATHGRRRAKTSLGPDMVPSTYSIYDSTPLPSRQSRGRPSLASIFRIPNSLKPHKVSGSHSAQSDGADEGGKARNATGESSSPSEEDWDQIDSTTDLDKVTKASGVGGDGMATVRGKGRSPYLQQPSLFPFTGGRTSPRPRTNASSSQSSLYEDSPMMDNIRPTRLSNVDENATEEGGSSSAPPPRPPSTISHANSSTLAPLMPPPRMSSRYAGTNNLFKNGSVRSMPPQPVPELRLAMTPENIRPLVENAKEVHGRLVECVAGIRSLLESHKSVIEPQPAK